MDLIYAHQPGTPITVHRPLSSVERQVLCASVDWIDDPEAASLLPQIWHARLWIGCDCRSRREAVPVLFVRRLGPTAYRLAPMGERSPHSSQCPFARAELSPGVRAAPRESNLATLLYRWFQAARLNVCYPYGAEDHLQQQYVALREAGKSLELSAGRRLYDYSRSHPAGLPELKRRIRAYRAAAPQEGGPHGVFLACVRELTSIELRSAIEPPSSDTEPIAMEVGSDWVQTLPEATNVGGPHVLLFGLVGTSAGVEVADVLAQPVYSRDRLILLGGAQERATLQALLQVQQESWVEHQTLIVLRKSLPGSALHERGIAFQAERLGPNGQAIARLDVLSVDPTSGGASPADWLPSSSRTESLLAQGTFYHVRATSDESERGGERVKQAIGAWVRAEIAGAQRGSNHTVAA